MELKIKGADFSNISIGSVVILPDQISQAVRTMIGFYANSNINANSTKARALEWLYQQLGGGEQNSLWSRMKYLFIPAMANDVRDCFYDLKGNGTLYLEIPNWCNSTNVELNSYGAKPKEVFTRGHAQIYADNVNPNTMINETVFGFTANNDGTPKTFCPINTNGTSSGNGANILVDNGVVKLGYINSSGNSSQVNNAKTVEQVNGLIAVVYRQSGDAVEYFVNGAMYESETMGQTTIAPNYKPRAFVGFAGNNVIYPQKETAICGKMDAITNAEADFLNRTFKSFMGVLV